MVKVLYWVLALLVAGYGIFCIRDPEDAVYLANFWRFEDFEPSDRYLRLTRLGGGLLILCAVIIIVKAYML